MNTSEDLAPKLHLLGNEQGGGVRCDDAIQGDEVSSAGDIPLVSKGPLAEKSDSAQLSLNQLFGSEVSRPKTSHDAGHQGDYDYRALADGAAHVLDTPDASHEKGRQTKLSQAVKAALSALGIQKKELEDLGIDLKSLNELISKELSCTHYLRWASIDNIIEKLIQGLVISKEDLKSAKQLCFPVLKQLARHMPHGRSIPLQQDWGIKKVQASRSIIQTTEQILINGVRLFIAIALSFRLYELAVKGSSDFAEFRDAFEANSQKGISGFVHALAKVDKTWLQLLLASPAIIGVIKGLWDGYQAQKLNSLDLIKIQTTVQEHTQPLQGVKQKLASYLWQDTLYQLIPIPIVTTVSEFCQKAERSIRWDGRITVEQRSELFNNIEQLALQGRALSKITAMQSMAKIAHSFSIQDFAILEEAGRDKETLMQLLKIKATALQNLRKMIKQPARQSIPTLIYAHYLLWWLGMGSVKSTIIFVGYKAITLSLEILFIKEIIDSILEAIRCPDKSGFRMFYGDYEIWANDLTVDCFREFVRQFRLISKKEAFQPFLDQMQNFHLQDVDAVDLSGKALTSNETRAILQILNQKMRIKYLNLSSNIIDETENLVFPNGLLTLNLRSNRIATRDTKQLVLPISLQSLELESNWLGPEGAKGLSLPSTLQLLDLRSNQIGITGARGLSLPSALQSLYLRDNQLGSGVEGLSLPPSLQSLDLGKNQIGDIGAKGLSLPSTLQSLDLGGNQIGDIGTKGLFLPPALQSLNLWSNQIGPEGVKGLPLPPTLQSLDLTGNKLGDGGAKGLSLPSTLRSLHLGYNQIGPEGVKGLSLPSTLQSLDLGGNQIGPEGAKGLSLPTALQLLDLRSNQISDAGIKQLVLPPTLQSLYLNVNQIHGEGIKQLLFPVTLQLLDLGGNQIGEGVEHLSLPPTLQSLDLGSNQIGDEGVKQLPLPSTLKFLYLRSNRIGDEGVKQLSLPPTLQLLDLSINQIGNEGVKAILRKTLKTQLTSIILDGNKYNVSAINADRFLQQQILLRYCKDKLCHANTPLQPDDPLQKQQEMHSQNAKEQHELLNTQLSQDRLTLQMDKPQAFNLEKLETSGAPRKNPCLFFSWMKKPLQSLKDQADACVTSTINSISARLRNVLSDCPSYFPNIHSPVLHDFHPPGPLMFSQFKPDYALTNVSSMNSLPSIPILPALDV